jgi:hypothetical protein
MCRRRRSHRRTTDAGPRASPRSADLTTLLMNITRPLGSESANGPTNGASTMYAKTKNCCRTGVCHPALDLARSAIAANKGALSASAEKLRRQDGVEAAGHGMGRQSVRPGRAPPAVAALCEPAAPLYHETIAHRKRRAGHSKPALLERPRLWSVPRPRPAAARLRPRVRIGRRFIQRHSRSRMTVPIQARIRAARCETTLPLRGGARPAAHACWR